MKHSFTNHPSINTVNQINNLACNIFKQLMLLLFMFTETDKVPQVFSSQDRRYVLLVQDIKKINSYSYKAKYKVYDTQSSLITSLKVNDDDADSELLQYAEWGPRSSQLASLTYSITLISN